LPSRPLSPSRKPYRPRAYHAPETVSYGKQHVELLAAQVNVTTPNEIMLYVRAFKQLARLAVYGDAACALIAAAIAALG
jgi:hypothetical protein